MIFCISSSSSSSSPSDGRAWSVGIDGGRRDGRELLLTQGEFLVRVTHESLHQRWGSVQETLR